MTIRVLITGGAGFIGSHLVDQLLQGEGYEVSILDSLDAQVHGKTNLPPYYLNKMAKFYQGSVTDYEKLEDLIIESDVIIHLASSVGVGQSMYKIKKYVDNNICGLTNLLDILVNSEHDVAKVLIASSSTVYGEGKYQCKNCGIIYPRLRSSNQINAKDWELNCPKCDIKIKPLLTDENSPLSPSSVYAFSKEAQERMSLMIGNTYGINTTILRFFLVYGMRQALSNPYTGVCNIFSIKALNGDPPIIFEDGNQSRDFVHVKDVCQALILALKKKNSTNEVYNVGTGIAIKIKEIAEIITKKINPKLSLIYNQQFRIGDIRHCVADISKIKNRLGYSPKFTFQEGVDDLIDWIRGQNSNIAKPSQEAMQELKEKGLLK